MAAPSLLLDFALLLIAAEIGGAAFRLLRMPPIVGMLAAGIALGPFTPGYVVDPAAVADLALLGAVFLMFSSGLSFDFRGFRRFGMWPFLLAILGVALSFVLGLGLGLLVGWSLLASLFLGLILSSTSTILGLKFLADFGLTDEAGAELVTAAIVLDDLAALSLMTIVVGVASPEPVGALSLVLGVLVAFGLAALLIAVGRRTVPPILRFTEKRSPSSTVMIAISFALITSFAFAVLGLPPLVGAFLAGSILAGTEFGPRVMRHVTTVTALFTGVFFASIGFLVDPARLPAILGLGLALIGISVVTKQAPAFFVLRRRVGLPRARAWRLSTVLIPRAEISLIIAQYGVLIGGPPELLGLAMILMVATALIPKLLVNLAGERTKPRDETEAPPA